LNTGLSAILAVDGEVTRGNPYLEPKAPQTCVEESPALWAGVLQWSVLDWNADAIRFYERRGAAVMPDWRICRVSGDALRGLAAKGG
jgi:hypothetical protein